MTEQPGRLIRFPQPGEGRLVDNDGDGFPDTSHPSTGDAVDRPVDADVIDAELVAETSAELATRDPIAVKVRRLPTQTVALVRDDPRAAVVRGTLRTAVTIVQGFESWAAGAWDAGTFGVYRRQIRTAESLGDQVLLAEWIDRKEHAKDKRHGRLMDLPRLLAGLAKATLGSLAALVVLVLLVGLFVQLSGKGAFTDVMTAVFGAIGWIFMVIAFAWTPLLVAVPGFVLLAAWRAGRRRGRAPGWLATSADTDVDVTIDETTIARALDALRIPQITSYIKEGLPLQYLTPARRDGRGTHAIVRLPAGVTAEKVARRRADLATGLYRLAKEVWPSTGAEAGILDLWVADKGALAEGAGPYPLLGDGLVDVFKGVPFGKTLRGDPLVAPVLERNTICGGMPGQGKSAAARVIMAGAALDPTAELRIWIPDSNFDFEAFKPRCSRYVMGAETEDIETILEHLRELHAEVQARGELLIRYEEPAVTRALANRNVDLHPLFCLLEEAHVAIQHKQHGEEIGQLLADIVRLGRKRAIHLIVSTQAPTKDSMPRDVTRNCSNGIAFAVGDHVANDALLGQGAYRAGHRATELIPGTDRGTAVVKGFSGERSEIAQVYFLDISKGNDQVTPIIARSLAAVAERGSVPGGDVEPPRAEASRDLLEDLAEVLSGEPARAADVPPRLRKLAPRWAPYKTLTGISLRERLEDEYGVKVATTGNRHPIDPVAIGEAIARRAAAEQYDDD